MARRTMFCNLFNDDAEIYSSQIHCVAKHSQYFAEKAVNIPQSLFIYTNFDG